MMWSLRLGLLCFLSGLMTGRILTSMDHFAATVQSARESEGRRSSSSQTKESFTSSAFAATNVPSPIERLVALSLSYLSPSETPVEPLVARKLSSVSTPKVPHLNGDGDNNNINIRPFSLPAYLQAHNITGSASDDNRKGGLRNDNRQTLADFYRRSQSVLEFGVGESTRLAAYVGVPRYVGIDSDAQWLATARQAAPPTFDFVWANVGPTAASWGRPEWLVNNTSTTTNPENDDDDDDHRRQNHYLANQAIWNYQVAPLWLMHTRYPDQPFDVYLIDGRFRLACAIASFLHALSTTNVPSSKNSRAVVLIHDCYRRAYHKSDSLFDVRIHGGGQENRAHKAVSICEFRLKEDTTVDQLLAAWQKVRNVVD